MLTIWVSFLKEWKIKPVSGALVLKLVTCACFRKIVFCLWFVWFLTDFQFKGCKIQVISKQTFYIPLNQNRSKSKHMTSQKPLFENRHTLPVLGQENLEQVFLSLCYPFSLMKTKRSWGDFSFDAGKTVFKCRAFLTSAASGFLAENPPKASILYFFLSRLMVM